MAADADAVVWLCDVGAPQRSLCVFDRRSHAILGRAIPLQVPLSSVDAAGVALSVKVLLQAGTAPTSAIARRSDPARPPLATPARDEAYRWMLEAGAGGRFWDVGAEKLAARFAADAVCAPALLGHRLGAGVGLALGPDTAITTGAHHPFLSSRLRDIELRFLGRPRAPLGPFWFEVDGGPALHFLSLQHDADPPMAMPVPLSESRIDISLDASLGLVFPRGPVLVAVRLGGFRFLTNEPVTGRPMAPVSLASNGADATLAIGFRFR